jgi:hypothetical protein
MLGTEKKNCGNVHQKKKKLENFMKHQKLNN